VRVKTDRNQTRLRIPSNNFTEEPRINVRIRVMIRIGARAGVTVRVRARLDSLLVRDSSILFLFRSSARTRSYSAKLHTNIIERT